MIYATFISDAQKRRFDRLRVQAFGPDAVLQTSNPSRAAHRAAILLGSHDPDIRGYSPAFVARLLAKWCDIHGGAA